MASQMTDKVEQAIKQLGNTLSQKDIVCLEISGKCNTQGVLEIKMKNPPQLTQNVSHKISLVSLNTTSFFPNVTPINNKFYYSNGTNEKIITLDTGGYSISDYNKAIQEAMSANGDHTVIANGNIEHNITIELNPATGKTRIIIKENYQVYFNRNNTWREILGFDNDTLNTNGIHVSTKIADVVKTEKIYVKCNLCSNTNFNGETSNIIFSFPNSKRYGSVLSFTPNPLIPRRLLNTNIDKIRLQFIDEDDNPVDFLNSNVCCTLLIEQF